MQHWLILINFGVQHQEETRRKWLYFGHLTLILSLHYLVKCRLLSLLFASGVNVCHLHLRWRRKFWAHAVIKRMWCDTCDFLRDNNCQSCLLLFSQSFLSRRICYPVWIHCCKWPNYDFCISQGNVATVLKWGGQNYSHLHQFFSWCRVPKIIKIDQCFMKLFKK